MGAFDAEVIVVGGGPAGSATASFLARAGVDVMLLDKAHFPRDKACAEYLSPQASRLLAEIGALEAIEHAGPARLKGMRIHAPDGRSFLGEFDAPHGFRGFSDHGLALRRSVLDSLLLDRARHHGARVVEGAAVTALLQDQGRTRGVMVRCDGERREVRARLVVGADGLRTVVGRRLGLVRAGSWPRRIAIVMHYTGVAEIQPHGEMHVFRDGYLGLADVGSGVTNVAIVVPARRGREMHGALDSFADRWIAARPAVAPRFATAARLTPSMATGPFNQRARRAWAPGAALVGDAADFFDPFTGEGIYAALRGAELLTPYAFEAVRSPDAKHDIALAAYDRSRHAEFRGKWAVERMVGMAVGFPMLFNRAAKVLAERRDMADLLVGVTGDFVPAREVLRPGYLVRLLVGSASSGHARQAAGSTIS
jgi:geranylgeranyl reductase family protein